MSLGPKSSLSLTLKRRRGRRNLKNAVDTDSIEGGESSKWSHITMSQRPSSSGAPYIGTSASLQQRLPSEEPFSHVEMGQTAQPGEDGVRDLSRSMTDGIFASGTGSSSSLTHEWAGQSHDNVLDISRPISTNDSPSSSSTFETVSSHSPLRTSASSFQDVTQTQAHHRLPNELLTLIFEQGSYLAHHRMFEPRYPLMAVRPPKNPSFMETVMCVCHRWRQVAIHTPALWTFLLITRSRSDLDRLPEVKDFQKPMESLTNALRRSHNLPLDITLDCTHISTKTVIGQLAPESHRWRSLSIMVPSIQALPLVLVNLMDIEAPMLETLEITSNKYHEGEFGGALPPFFKSTPKLTSVRLNRVCLLWSASPLQQLTTLELRFIVWPRFTDLNNIFVQSPALENLVLHFDTSAFSRLERSTRPLIPIPCLRTLELRFFYESTQNIVPLLQLFSMPTLESLTLKDVHPSDWCRSLVYFRCYAASYPALRSLTLNTVKDLIYVDSSTVRAFPHLTHLSLVGVYSNAFCQLLMNERTDDRQRTLVWPKLKSLSIQNDSQAKIGLLEAAIQARADMGRPITSVELDQRLFDSNYGSMERLTNLTNIRHVDYVHC